MGLASNLKVPFLGTTNTLLSRLANTITTFHHRSYSDDRIVPATDDFVWNTSMPVKIRMDENTTHGNCPPVLVQTMMRKTVSEFGSKMAIVSHDGKIKWTYQDYYDQVQAVAKGFISLDLTPMHGVGIMANNHPYWQASALGTIFAGGLTCGIYLTNSPSTVKYISEQAPLDLMVIQNQKMLNHLLQNEPEIKDIVKSFVIMEDDQIISNSEYKNIFTWQEMLQSGKSIKDEILAQREENQAVNKACALMYTSGTTGPPKGAMLSHDNVTWTSMMCMEHYGWHQERILCYLPLSHMAAIMIDCFMPTYAANEVHFADSEALKGTLVENLKRVRPTKFLAVPRVWEKIAEKMQSAGKSSKGLKKVLGDWAKSVSTEHHTLVREGKIKPNQEKLTYRFAQKLILSKVHQALGLDQIKSRDKPGFTTGSAPIPVETLLYFQSLDIMIAELYGSTECMGPATTNMSGSLSKIGSVGLPYTGVNNKLLNPDSDGIGEICTKSRNVFMGYHKDEVRTKEAFDKDGWYKSGDLGRLDQDGFLWISGRIKELLITSGGENIPPVPIENQIKSELPELISNVIVIGDNRKYLTCLVSLKCKVNELGIPTNILEDEVKSFCKRMSSVSDDDIQTIEDFKNDPKLINVIQASINNANSKATANPHKVQKFFILPIDLSVAGEELGPTLKLKRHFIIKKYSVEISKMYEE